MVNFPAAALIGGRILERGYQLVYDAQRDARELFLRSGTYPSYAGERSSRDGGGEASRGRALR